jgi:hypothetical protein
MLTAPSHGLQYLENSKVLNSLSPEKLDEIAKDIALNKIFTSAHMRPNDWATTLGLVFMPLALGAFASEKPKDFEVGALKDDGYTLQDIGLFYEYWDKAGPRSINGYPIFFSCAVLNHEDTKYVLDKAREIQEKIEAI